MMDEARFEKLYAAQARPLWSYICRIAGSATLADDILQETFLRLLRSSLAETDENAVKAYLYRIATNLVYDHFRRTKRESLWQLRWRPPASSVEEAINDSGMESSDMARVFGELKDQERALLWLAYIEGYEHREIAGVLELSATSVRVLLFRARRKLARLLEEKGLKAKVRS